MVGWRSSRVPCAAPGDEREREAATQMAPTANRSAGMGDPDEAFVILSEAKDLLLDALTKADPSAAPQDDNERETCQRRGPPLRYTKLGSSLRVLPHSAESHMSPIVVHSRRVVLLGLLIVTAVESPILAQRAAGAPRA